MGYLGKELGYLGRGDGTPGWEDGVPGWGDGVPGRGRMAQGSRQEEGAWGGPSPRGSLRQRREANPQVAPEMRLGQLFPQRHHMTLGHYPEPLGKGESAFTGGCCVTWTRGVPQALTPVTGTQPHPSHDLVPPGKGPAGIGAARPKSPAPSCRATPRLTSERLVPTHSVPSGPIPKPPAWAPGSRLRLSIARLSSRDRGLHRLEPGSPEVTSTSNQPDCFVHLGEISGGSPSTRPHLQEATCAHQAPRPQAGSEAPLAHLALGVPAPPHAGPQQECAQGRGGSRHPALRCLPWGFQPSLPTGHAPSGQAQD